MEAETWRPIAGYEGLYEVSNQGQVRSLPHRTSSRFGLKMSPGRVLKPFIARNGYYRVDLSKDGKSRRMSVHRLVALSFVPPVLGKPNVNHKNSNKRDNHPENLEWCTVQENTKHWIARVMPNGWSFKYDKCVECGTTESPHNAKGVCHRCHARNFGRVKRAELRQVINQEFGGEEQ